MKNPKQRNSGPNKNSYKSDGSLKPQSIRNKNWVEFAHEISELPSYDTDPFGSYTGKPRDKYDVPVQDADDL